MMPSDPWDVFEEEEAPFSSEEEEQQALIEQAFKKWVAEFYTTKHPHLRGL